MNQEELIKKLREMANRRDMEIFLSENEKDKNILEKHFVIDVEYLGEVDMADNDLQENLKSVYKIIEQDVNKEGEIIIVERFYTEDFQFLGGNNKSDGQDFITLGQEILNIKKIDSVKLQENLNSMPDKGISLEELEKKELKEIAKVLGINDEEINSMSEMELAQEIEQKEQAQGTEEKQEQKEINKEEVKQISNQKQEINLNTKVDDKRTLGQALDLDTSEFSKVAIVYSDRLNEITNSEDKINNTRYSFVAIRKDGTALNISDRLQVDARTGNNQNRDSIKIDADKTARKDNNTKSRFQIIGENGKNAGKSDYEKETLSIENGQYGEIKAYYGKGRSRHNNENIETQLETSNVRPTTRELRSLQADRKGQYNTDKMVEEADKYLDKNSEEKVSMYNVDGDEYTVADEVEVFVENHIDEWTEVVMEDTDVSTVFTENEVNEMITNYWVNEYAEEEKNDDGKIDREEVEKINEEIKGKIVEDAENLNREHKR